mgnify:CR=1 FL=1
MSDSHNLDFLGRRELLKLGAAGLGLGATSGLSPIPASVDLDQQQQRPDMGPAPAKLFAADPIDLVRIGFVGVGGMGGAQPLAVTMNVVPLSLYVELEVV